MSEIREELSAKILKLEFVEPQFELRFEDLLMDEIQKIKEHPIVVTIGKTEMSRYSINVVIG
jgi:hypothetical protein